MLKALRIPFLMLTIAGLMLLVGCNRIADPTANLPEPIDVHASTWAFNTDLVINQTIQGGVMSVAMTYDYVYVSYSTANGWRLTASQVHMATTKNGIPHDANGMLPAQFAYKTTHSPDVQTYVYTIPMQTAWRNAGVFTSRRTPSWSTEGTWAKVGAGVQSTATGHGEFTPNRMFLRP